MGRKTKTKELICLRNQKLIQRYYELFECDRMRLDDVLNKLSREEFFISPEHILVIIKKNNHLYEAMKEGKGIDS